jgi:elongation factor P
MAPFSACARNRHTRLGRWLHAERAPPLTFCLHTILSSNFNFLYATNQQDSFFFMNSATFEEIPVGTKIVGDKDRWIGEGSEVKLVLFKDNVIEVVPPSPAVYVIAETEPNMKGNTAQGYTKPATLDCGAVINVPGFLEQGQKIRVDTEKGEYLERVQ